MKEAAKLAKQSPNVDLIQNADIIRFAIKEFVNAPLAMNVTILTFAYLQALVMEFSVLKMVSVVSINTEESTSVSVLMDMKAMESMSASSFLLPAM